MNCRDLQAQIVGYLDGELDDARASACRGHLRTCADCRGLADEHARLREALTTLPTPEPPTAMWRDINARLGAAEVADSERGRVAQAWARLRAWSRPVLWPAAMVASAGAIALVVVQLRAGAATAPLAVAPLPSPEHLAALPPSPSPPPIALALRDATDEQADLAADSERRFRAAAAELLTLARGEAAAWPTSRARRFTREVERREKAVLAAAAGGDRDRAWHELIAYLERAALGEPVAALGGG